MLTPVETLLTSAGIPPEDVSSILTMSEDDQKIFDPNPYLEKVKGNYQTQFQNDPAFFNDLTIEKLPPDIKKKIESAQYGRAANITRDKLIKGLGLTEADIADLSPEQKEKLELFVPALAEKYSKTKAGDKQLQEDLINARKELEKYGPDYETKLASEYETKAEQKITAAIFNANLIGELSSIQGLKIPAGDIAPIANSILQSKYGFERVGDFSVELRQKANPQMKVLKDGSSKELTLKEALQEIATERGWVESEREDSKGGGTVLGIVPGKGGALEMVPPHLREKISNKIAAQ